MNTIRKSDIFSHWANLSYLPRWGVLLLDLFIVLVSFTISIVIGSHLWEYKLPELLIPNLGAQATIVVLLQVVFFWIFHTYSGILRYSTFVDIIKVILAVASCTAILIGVNITCRWMHMPTPFLTTSLIIYLFVSTCLLFVWRVTIKTTFVYISHHNQNIKKVLIYGTQSAGLSIAKMLQSNLESQYQPVGFIVDHHDNHNHNLLGLHLYPLNADLIPLMQRKEISCIIVSPIKMKKINPIKDLSIFIENNIQILTTPYFTDFNDPSLSDNHISQAIGRIESIKVEDLLERPVIDINTENVAAILHHRTVMITGAAGSIGSEIVRQVAAHQPLAIILLEMAESPLHDLTVDLRRQFSSLQIIPIIADVRDRQLMHDIFEEYRPHVVFHAAAYKHVPLMEDFPTQAVLANVMGTKNVADCAMEFGTERFVMVSTDKAVNPTNVMGASKRIAEIYVQSLFLHHSNMPNCTKFITTRFGNVLGSNGSVVPFFKKQIAEGGPVTVTHPDIIRYFMTIPEASCLVLEAATLGEGGEIFCFDMGQPVRIADLAYNMIRLAGLVPGKDIKVTFTGLRPGEKLYEELLNQKETTIPTSHKKILVAKVREYDFNEVALQIDKLIALAQSGKAFPTVQAMKTIVPEFKSKNSVYEKLD